MVTIRAVLTDEQGTPYEPETLFGAFEHGMVFDYGEWQARDLAQMLERDGKARQLEQVLTLPIRQAPWDIEPAKGDSGEAEFVKDALTSAANAGGMSTPMKRIIGQATSASLYRKSFFEKVFVRRDGRIVYDKIAYRPPSSCEMAREPKHGGFRGFRQRVAGPITVGGGLTGDKLGYIYIPEHRAWVHINGMHRDPLNGVSDLDIAYWCYETKAKIRFLWYQFLEGQSLPKGVTRDADDETARQAARKVASLKSGGVVNLKKTTTLDVFESSGKGADQFQAAIKFLDSEMAGSVLAGFTDLTSSASEGKGSFALSSDQSDFFLQSRVAVADELAESITHYVVADLVKYNFGTDAACPTFAFGQISETDAGQAITLLQALAAAPSLRLPEEFVGQLATKVAGYLDLDVDEVEKAIKEHAEQARQQAEQQAQQQHEQHTAAQQESAARVAQMKGAVDGATQMVQRGQQGKRPLPKKTTTATKTSAKK